jgi:hypothetical protein
MQIFSKRKRNNGTIFSKRKRNNSVIFSKRKRNDRFFSQCYKFRDHHRRSVGVLWASVAFYKHVSTIMLQKSSARLLRFGRYTNICLKEAQEWREICCLEGFWKEVERYTIIKISVVVPLAKL